MFLHSDTLTTIVPVIVVQIITALLVRVKDAEGDLVVVVLNVLLEKHQALERGTYLNALRALLENIFLAINVYLVLLENTNLIQDKQAVIRVVVAPILEVDPKAVLIVV